MKKLTKALTLALATTLIATPIFASSLGLRINNEYVNPVVAPFEQNGTTLVPLRIVSENLGAKVDWDAKTKQITIVQDETTIILTVGSKTAKVNGVAKELPLAPQVKSNTTMVPIRFVSENLSCSVNWDKTTQTVSVNAKDVAFVESEGKVLTVKNPEIINGKPFVTVQWLIDNMGATTSENQWGKSVTSKYNSAYLRDDGRVQFDSRFSPFDKDFKSGSSIKSYKMSADLVAKTFCYIYTYDANSKTLTFVPNPPKTQEADENGDYTIKGYVKYWDGSVGKNLTLVWDLYDTDTTQPIQPSQSKWYPDYDATKNIVYTDANGYYEFKVNESLFVRENFQYKVRVLVVSDVKVETRDLDNPWSYFKGKLVTNRMGMTYAVSSIPNFYMGTDETGKSTYVSATPVTVAQMHDIYIEEKYYK